MTRYPALELAGSVASRLAAKLHIIWPGLRVLLARLWWAYLLLVLLSGGLVLASDLEHDPRISAAIRSFYPFPSMIVYRAETTANPLRFLSVHPVPLKDISREGGVLSFFDRATKGTADRDTNERLARERIIEAILIEREAKRLGVVVTSTQARRDFLTLASKHGGVEAFREQVLRRLYGIDEGFLIERWITEKLYRLGLAQVRARHILIALPNPATPAQEVEGKRKIEVLKAKIESGLPFDQAAKEFSEDTTTKDKGGALGTFGNGDVASKAFEDAALSAPVEQLVGPVRSEFGWHLLLVEERTGKLEGAFNPWLDELKSKSQVWILDPKFK